MEINSKKILDKWATLVNDKDSIFLRDNNAQVNANKTRHYREKGYTGNEVLWVPPKDSLVIEFEDDPYKNERYIAELESAAISLGFDYCVTGHNGKSDYFRMFNIKNLPLNEDNKLAKLLLIETIMPESAKKELDRTNLGWTLSPVIGHPHWKPKYMGKIHKFIRGKDPLQHENTYPKDLLKTLNKSKKLNKTHIVNTLKGSKWVSDFLLNYCCNNKLPKGDRHHVIEKNLAAFIIHRNDRDSIKKTYFEVQKRTTDTLRTWETAILNGDYTEVSPGELVNYIKNNEIDFVIPNEKYTSEDIVKELDKRFYDESLLSNIYEEIDKLHKLDIKEKLGVFITALSGELPDDRDHCSVALKGDSSAGKDNVIDSIFKMFPENQSIKLTSGTKAAIEENVDDIKRLAFSEMNQHRDDGANKDLVEFFKQLSEGGLNSIKKDASTGYATTKTINVKQKSLFYGTTESKTDEELDTRYIIIPIKSNSNKNKVVVDDVLDNISSVNYILNKYNKNSNWVSQSINLLDKNIYPIIPFGKVFKNKIEDVDGKEKYLFDYTKDRIKRDAKRLFSLTKAITWLYQKQRVNEEIDGYKFVYSEPCDFICALKIFSEFFNFTYHGLDHRTQTVYDTINKLKGKHKNEIKALNIEQKYSEWVIRTELQKELGYNSLNAIKKHITILKDRGMIDTYFDRSIPKGYLISPVISPVISLSLPITLTGIDRSLTGQMIGKEFYKKHGKNKLSNIFLPCLDDKGNLHDNKTIPTPLSGVKNDRSKMIGVKILENYTEKIKKIPWEQRCIVHRKCDFDGCNAHETNEAEDGKFYCRPHFEGMM